VENTAHEDNRDLRFDLGGNWIKAARLKEDILSDLSNFLPAEREGRSGSGRRNGKEDEKAEINQDARRVRWMFLSAGKPNYKADEDNVNNPFILTGC